MRISWVVISPVFKKQTFQLNLMTSKTDVDWIANCTLLNTKSERPQPNPNWYPKYFYDNPVAVITKTFDHFWITATKIIRSRQLRILGIWQVVTKWSVAVRTFNLASLASGSKVVKVRVFSWARSSNQSLTSNTAPHTLSHDNEFKLLSHSIVNFGRLLEIPPCSKNPVKLSEKWMLNKGGIDVFPYDFSFWRSFKNTALSPLAYQGVTGT